jgi:hypothetical protein
MMNSPALAKPDVPAQIAVARFLPAALYRHLVLIDARRVSQSETSAARNRRRPLKQRL